MQSRNSESDAKFDKNSLSEYSNLNGEELLSRFLSEAKVPSADAAAKELLEKAGSFQGLFSTELCDLEEKYGIDQNIAILISCLGSVSDKIVESFFAQTPINCEEIAASFLVRALRKSPADTVVILYLDKKNRLVKLDKRLPYDSDGINTVAYLKSNLDKMNPAKVILAHKHDNDNMEPSYQDVEATVKIHDMCAERKIPVEHYIIGENSYHPIVSYITGKGNGFFD